MLQRWLTALCLALQCGALLASPSMVDPLAGEQELSSELRLLRDPDRLLGFAEVLAKLEDLPRASRRELVTGFNPGIVWLHISLTQSGTQSTTRWLAVGSAKTQFVTLYQRQQKDWTVMHSGRAVLPAERPIVTPAPVFPVVLAPGQTTELLLRVDSRGSTDLETTLWQPEAYHAASSRQAVGVAALLGGLLLASLLGLVVYVVLRESQYLWHALVLLSIAGLEASRTNFLGTFIWPADRQLPPASLALFATLALFSLSKVAVHALELATRLPAANRLLTGLRWFAAGSALLTPFYYGHGVRLLSLTSVTQNIAVLALSLHAWRQGLPNGRIFLLAFSLGLLVEIARQLANLGILPWAAALDSSSLFFLLASPLILLGLLAQTRQLSERLRFADQLQSAKSAFLARISHELRSPLNTILGYSRMLARRSGTLSLTEGTSGIEKSVLRLLRQIDELLDEARIAAGKLLITPAPLALRPWLEEIENTARLHCEAQNNQLVCNFSGNLAIMVEIDGQRLRQILENFLANANRHTRNGTLKLVCGAVAKGATVELSFAVEDNGEGIAPAQLARLFEPFERGKTTTPGHGLGLSICRELIRQMGSDIIARSIPDQGSWFGFALTAPLLGKITELKNSGASLNPAQSNDRPRVLIVEDDAVQRKLLAAWIEECGWAVGHCSNGQSAIAAYDQDTWDAVITDQMMPGVAGWMVLEHIRSRQPELPVLMLSAAEPCRPDSLAGDCHFSAFLRKPVSAAEIQATLWQLLLQPGRSQLEIPVDEWLALARLSAEGEVSGIQDWIAACRTRTGGSSVLLDWVEAGLHRLDLDWLERVGRQAASSARGINRVGLPPNG